MSRISHAVSIPVAEGHQQAQLDLPTGTPPRAYALFAHCFAGSKQHAAALISDALTEAGIAVLRFELAPPAGSEDDAGSTTPAPGLAVVAAAAWLGRDQRAPALLVGHGVGGAAALAAAASIPEAVAIATINAPAGPSLAAAIATLSQALIVFHSSPAATVGVDDVSSALLAAQKRGSFVSLDDADQLLTRGADARYVGAVLAAWASRHLPARSGDPHSPDGPRDVVRVTETGAGKFQVEIAIGPHRLIADEPVSAGGDDSGPTPYDLLTAALGACTAMTLRQYADLKGLPLERARVNLRHEKIHASDCAECETKEGRIDRIERVVDLDGPLDDAARAKLLEIANKCPVHRTLHGEVSIPTRLAAP
jgi:putative redox protein